MKYHFKVHQEGEGFWAECLELDGCVTQGDSLEELCDNLEEALNLYLAEPEGSRYLAPLPFKSVRKNKSVIEVPVDPQVAFAFMVRHHRLKSGMTQKEAAKTMGFDTLYSYQRLESKRCNPSLKTISKIKSIFPEFSVDGALAF